MQLKYLFVVLITLVLFAGCTQETSDQEKNTSEETNKTVEDSTGNAGDIVTTDDKTDEEDSELGDTEEDETNEPELLDCITDCCNDSTHVKKDCIEGKICENNVCKSKTPIDTLSNELIEQWGVDCKDKGTEEAIANCILEWQESNFYWCYTHPETTSIPEAFETGYADCVVDMQFNQMELGSFPVSKVMELKIRNEKIFGACYTYSVTYCAVARWNGLECRVISAGDPNMESNEDMGNGYCGLASKEYIENLGLNCGEWKDKGWKMQAWHYWAEVLINGEWKRMETSIGEYMGDTQKYIIDAGMEYKILDW